MKNFIRKSNPQQLIDILDCTEHKEWNKENIQKELISNFDIFELFEFVKFAHKKYYFDIIFSNLKMEDFYTICDTSYSHILQVENSLNSIDFMAYLISYKLKLIEKSNINIDYFFDKIDVKIIQTKAILNEIKFDIFSTNEMLGLFFIFDKYTAKSKLKFFITKLIRERTQHDVFAYTISKVNRFFTILNLDFIPTISYENYKGFEIFNNEDNIFITKSELQNIINEKEYFSLQYPLENINPSRLLNDKNFYDKEYVYSILRNYFKYLLDKDFKYLETNIFEIFISNITDKYPRFDKYYLKHANVILSDFIDTNMKKEKFLAIFYLLHDKGELVGVRNKLSELLSEYFKGKISYDSTRDALYQRGRSQRLLEEIDYLREWIKL